MLEAQAGNETARDHVLGVPYQDCPSPYLFHDFPEYLDSILVYLKQFYGSRFSLSWLAKQLGFRSHQSVAHLSRGSRLPSDDFLKKLGKWMELSPGEQIYLELLVLRRRRMNSGQDGEDVRTQLNRLRPKKIFRKQLQPSEMNFMAHWWNLPIRNIVAMKGFRFDPVEIAKRFRSSITSNQVVTSLENMTKIGVLKRVDGPERYKLGCPNVASTVDVPVDSIRQYHREQLDEGKRALKEVSVQLREFSALTLRCPRERIEEAKQFLRSMMDEFDAKFSDLETEDVLQLNLQLFPVTRIEADDAK